MSIASSPWHCSGVQYSRKAWAASQGYVSAARASRTVASTHPPSATKCTCQLAQGAKLGERASGSLREGLFGPRLLAGEASTGVGDGLGDEAAAQVGETGSNVAGSSSRVIGCLEIHRVSRAYRTARRTVGPC